MGVSFKIMENNFGFFEFFPVSESPEGIKVECTTYPLFFMAIK